MPALEAFADASIAILGGAAHRAIGADAALPAPAASTAHLVGCRAPSWPFDRLGLLDEGTRTIGKIAHT
jgi:hypothetical protein